MKLHHSIYILAALTSLSAAAQQKLEETLYVEGEYVPTVVRQDKIHLLPQKVSFDIPMAAPPASSGLLTGDYRPAFLPMSAPVWRGELQSYPWRGYLNLALGSYLNSSLSAGYAVARSENTRANIWLQHNSTSLFHPRLNAESHDRTRYRYDEQIGADLRHSLGHNGILSGAVNYHLGYFNYYGVAAAVTPRKAPSQTLNDASLALNWQSAARGKWLWTARVAGSYFGYNRFYTAADAVSRAGNPGQHEVEASVGGSASLGIADDQRVRLGLDFTNLSYNKALADARSRSLQTIRLMPSYTFTSDRFSTGVGVVADLTWGAGRSLIPDVADLKYSTFHVAPNVRLSYDAGLWSAQLTATGGQQLQTLRTGYQLDYYQQPLLDYLQPAFVPVEAALRLQLNGTGRFRAGMDFTFKSVKNLYLGGWYMNNLSEGPAAADAAAPYADLNGFSIGLDAEWQPFNILTLRGRATWQPQETEGIGFFNGYDRPVWTVDVQADVRPVKNLSLTLAYHYRGVRNIYWGYDTQNRFRLPDICNLSFGARYRISRILSIYGSADNLLCKRLLLLPSQPAEGFNFLVGADILF